MRMCHYAGAIGLAVLVLLGGSLWAPAEDVIMTQNREYRGQVRSVSPKGIRIALIQGGEIDVPRSLVVGVPKVTPPPGLLRGIEAYEKGNLKDAQLNLSKEAMLYQGLDLDWAMKAILYYGRTCLAAGDYAQADKLFDAFLEAYEDESMATGAKVGKANINMAKKDYEQAVIQLLELEQFYDKQWKVSKDQLPYAAETCLALGKCLEAQSKDAQALKAYLKIVALYPVEAYCPEALYRAARLYRKLDQPQQAAALYADLIGDYADNDLAKKAVLERAELPPAPGAKP